MRWFFYAIAALAICLAIYAGSAFASLASLVVAVRRGDAEHVVARTDLPRVRHAMVDQLIDAYLRRLGRQRPVKPFERLAINTFGASIADELAGKLMTRENIAALLQTGAVRGDAEIGAIPPLANVDLSNVATYMGRIVPIKPVEFSLRLGSEEDAGSISMHFSGDGWKLSAINLPARMLSKLVERLPTR
ncbi:DUF2939 domain-containing protein [Bradyrhizobium canariense]|uniref:DUF2939 domain-containing protein n=1 Tax=Bradyrhizobium canariense TaxID=255045 RepID=UPI001C667750|nr:DUF2939 domain-containing protein [Bradyrhizobium canariense]MBW5435801.1 DUF2939 domain-containing protein [Bradyrhizobium canariense]